MKNEKRLKAAVVSHSHRQLAAHAPQLRSQLAEWFTENRRALPWRENPSLYKTVVSEFMLQQTQIKTALPYFERWMAALPNFPALAAASEATVLKLWEGLGYYSRARNLHRLAQALAQRKSPPVSTEDWQSLPGVGPYTAAAISSIACHQPAACVDGNVIRVLARLTGDRTAFASTADALKMFSPLATALLDQNAPGKHNEAMMELGATVCTKTAPRCNLCPLANLCIGQRASDVASIPLLQRKATQAVQIRRIVCTNNGRLLLHKSSSTSRSLAGLCEIPSADQLGMEASEILPTEPLFVGRRTITNRRIEELFFKAKFPRKKLPETLIWVPLAELEKITLSGPHRRWLKRLLDPTSGADRPS